MRFHKIRNYLPILLTIVFMYTASCNSISTKTYKISTPLLKKESGLKIVQISDLHSSIYGKDQKTLTEKIKKINPDLIFLTGDIYDYKEKMDGVGLLLSGISGIAPVYYVTGNHEYWSRNIQKIKEELLSHNVVILSDEYRIIEIKDNMIVVAGIDDPDKALYEASDYDQDKSMENAFRQLDENPSFKILLAHRPERIEKYKKFAFNLVLSGHTHGGQVRIPLILNGLYAPHQGLFPKYAGGEYKHGNLTHIVNRGLSINHPKIPRLFNPRELVVIIITSNS